MKKLLSFLLSLLVCHAYAQQLEMADPKKPKDLSSWQAYHSKTAFQFVDAEFGVSKHLPPTGSQNMWQTVAWKNETVQTQLAFWSTQSLANNQVITLAASPLKSKSHTIASQHIHVSPISYVMSDDPSKLKKGCAIKEILDSVLVADRIENNRTFTYKIHETRPVWLSIYIPSNTPEGEYKGQLTASFGIGKNKKTHTVSYSVLVKQHTLPDAKDWAFHLDLWQNPYSSARYYKLKPFSKEHLNKITPHIQRLANAGQKSITATLIYDPWNGQTYDKYDGMIKWAKKRDGSWQFDYTDFDNWVNYMHGQGISKFINCYSMIPWNLSFYYQDEESGTTKILKAKPGEDAYEQHWLPFLKDFARHLKSKGWFVKTTIAMDERPMKDMLAAIAIIKKADKDFKISLAGTYHEELAMDLLDYCITLNETMPDAVLAKRKALGYTTTMYTCCSEIFPNTFTSSGQSEPIWLAWNTVQRGFDGYLRWAFDCWNSKPNQDARFGTWPAGDTWFIYPDNATSIRFERLREGIQDVEKIRIIKQKLADAGKTEELKQLEAHIQNFSNKNINRNLIPQQVKNAKIFLNSL